MPPYLYKFLPVSHFSYETVALNKAWFSTPSSLNDPYDGQLPINTDVADADEAFQLAGQMNEMANEWKGGILPFDPKASDFQDCFRQFTRDWLANGPATGIYSMTATVKHLLLWAHYADSHKGFAIRYKIPAYYSAGDDDFGIHEVKYVASVPKIHIKDIANSFYGTHRGRFTTKGTFWVYEEEWRAITINGNRLLDAPGIIDQIIFGHRMSLASKQTLRRIAGDEVNYFEARPSDDSFAVEIVPI